jgi:chaperonin GroEL (HSP60 family)
MKEKKARVQGAMHATKVADLVKPGVIDPTKFVRAALANGSSIA